MQKYEKYKVLFLQGMYLLNLKTKKPSFVFPSKWFSTKNVKIIKKKNVCIQSISKGDNSWQTDGRTDGRSGTFPCTLHFLW